MVKQTKLLSITITVLGFILILYKTLFPFNFLFEETFSGSDKLFFIFGWGKSDPWDFLLNVLLFLPLGFGLTSYLMQKKSAVGLLVLGVILLVSFGLSYSIEILQVFQPSRFPALSDIFSNCVGGLLGYFFYRSYQIRSFKQ